MKRNVIAMLLALVMIAGCILAATPAVFATEADSSTAEDTNSETNADTPGDTATDNGTETPGGAATDTNQPSDDTSETPDDSTNTETEEPKEAPQPKMITKILIWLINFFKKLLAQLGL